MGNTGTETGQAETVSIYFAARYSLKPLLQRVRDWFAEHGYTCTSHWLEEPESPTVQLPQLATEELAATYSAYARRDIQDIHLADYFVAIAEEPTRATVRGGRHVEFGFALAVKNTSDIIIVGPKENIFHYVPGPAHLRTLAQLATFFGLEPDEALAGLDEELLNERLSN